MLDGDTEAKELNLNLNQSIETLFWDSEVDQLCFLWINPLGYWLEYEDAAICMKTQGMYNLKTRDLEFIALVD